MKKDNTQKRKKSFGWIIPLALAGAIAAGVTMLPRQQASPAETMTVNQEIISGRASAATIVNTLSGAGVLAASETESATFPEVIEIDCYHVQNGDRVKKGDILASVNKISVEYAIVELKSVIESLDKQLDYKAAATNKDSIASPAAGRVKEIYISQGEHVGDDPLMLINLDGLMQAGIRVPDYIVPGTAVLVCTDDGTVEEKGTVQTVQDGIANVTFSDENTKNGTLVKIYDREGCFLGSATATVHCPWLARGYYGTVTNIPVFVDQKVYSGTPIVYLTDTGNTDEYYSLYLLRQKLEEQMEELFALNRDGYIRAEYDGIVADVPGDAEIKLLASTGSTAKISLLSAPLTPYKITLLAATTAQTGTAANPSPSPTPSGLTGYVCKITGINGTVVSLKYSTDTVTIADYSSAISLATALSMLGQGDVDFSGVNTLSTAGQPMTPAELAVGDILFFDSAKGAYIKAGSSGGSGNNTPGGSGGGSQGGGKTGGGASSGGGMPSGGGKTGSSAGTGTTQADYEAYSTERAELLTLIGTDNMTIEILIDELDILNVTMGMKTAVTLDAMKGQAFEGIVTSIDQTGTNSGGNTKYYVEVTILKGENMLEGMNASVIMETGVTEAAVTVPLAAISEEGGKSVIYKGYDEKTDTLTDPVEVTTGKSDGETVEILSGLNASESYYYRYADSVSYGFMNFV